MTSQFPCLGSRLPRRRLPSLTGSTLGGGSGSAAPGGGTGRSAPFAFGMVPANASTSQRRSAPAQDRRIVGRRPGPAPRTGAAPARSRKRPAIGLPASCGDPDDDRAAGGPGPSRTGVGRRRRRSRRREPSRRQPGSKSPPYRDRSSVRSAGAPTSSAPFARPAGPAAPWAEPPTHSEQRSRPALTERPRLDASTARRLRARRWPSSRSRSSPARSIRRLESKPTPNRPPVGEKAAARRKQAVAHEIRLGDRAEGRRPRRLPPGGEVSRRALSGWRGQHVHSRSSEDRRPPVSDSIYIEFDRPATRVAASISPRPRGLLGRRGCAPGSGSAISGGGQQVVGDKTARRTCAARHPAGRRRAALGAWAADLQFVPRPAGRSASRPQAVRRWLFASNRPAVGTPPGIVDRQQGEADAVLGRRGDDPAAHLRPGRHRASPSGPWLQVVELADRGEAGLQASSTWTIAAIASTSSGVRAVEEAVHQGAPGPEVVAAAGGALPARFRHAGPWHAGRRGCAGSPVPAAGPGSGGQKLWAPARRRGAGRDGGDQAVRADVEYGTSAAQPSGSRAIGAWSRERAGHGVRSPA